jgi:hypothetical protein
MAALTAERNTLRKLSSFDMVHGYTGIDSDEFYKGALLMYDQSDSRIKPATAATDAVCIGRCLTSVSTGASNTTTVEAESGIFRWENSSAGDAIAADDIGKPCYMVDDQTVALTDGTGTRSKAGTIYDVDASGVWVATVWPAASL